jgi:ABC-type sugar transport system ATPase subunit
VPELSLEAVSKIYPGAVVALDRIDLHVRGPRLLGVVGPSGSGKSTLLRVIAGLEEMSSGHVSLDGLVLDDLAPRDRDVALMFQEHTLFPHMTVRDNLGFGLRVRGVERTEARRRVADAAGALELEPLLARYPDQLSGGERQRVALGRALVRRPRLLLLDEPLSSVDAQLRVQLRVEIARTCRTLGGIVILVTHDQMDAMAIADEIAVMRQGRLEQIGDPATLYDDPANRFVAEFIGPHGMNLFDGHVETGDHGIRFVHPEFTVDVPGAWRGRLPTASSAATLGVRPEGISLGPARPDDPTDRPASIRSTVEIVERAGAQVFVHFPVAGHTYSAVVPAASAPRPGDRLTLQIDPTAVRFFDRATGQAL